MKAVLDTNVIISGLINSEGAPARVVDLWVNGSIRIATSLALIQKILDVIARPKFKPLGTLNERCDLIKKLLERAEIVNPPQRLKIISEDDADNRILECALAYSADYIISGDSHLLNLGDYKGIEILSPDEFLSLKHKLL
ncbi:MAG: putative toxin-antitoxin system toxin component, PIN family [Actinomycetota bacterium]|nr:putative toxin-antitoxin system toxin component, PIN family [Actinomycetota bacterium]